jgi:UDP-N-acetylglucosamine--dolichyl-phosphate N-acetylglucosaminephosphotransferase
MEPSTATVERPLAKPIQEVMKLLHSIKLLRVKIDDEGTIVEYSNLTLINLWLIWFGPVREDTLVMGLVAFQTVIGIFGLLIRHRLALFFFATDNIAI